MKFGKKCLLLSWVLWEIDKCHSFLLSLCGYEKIQWLQLSFVFIFMINGINGKLEISGSFLLVRSLRAENSVYDIAKGSWSSQKHIDFTFLFMLNVLIHLRIAIRLQKHDCFLKSCVYLLNIACITLRRHLRIYLLTFLYSKGSFLGHKFCGFLMIKKMFCLGFSKLVSICFCFSAEMYTNICLLFPI